jgi:flagellar hook-length control protein FliK
MRTLPQTEVRSLPAPASQETQSPATNRGDGHNFAETLQRKSAADERPESPRKNSQPTEKNSANDTVENVSSATKRPPADHATNATEEPTAGDLTVTDAPVVAEPTNVQTNPLTLGDLGLALAMSASAMEPAVAAPTATPETLPEFALKTVVTATKANGDVNPMASTEMTMDAVVAALAELAALTQNAKNSAAPVTEQTALTDISAQILASVNANALTTGDSATTDLAAAMSAAAASNRIPTAPNTKIADAQLVSDAVEVVANDVDMTAALPPVIAPVATAKAALPTVKDHLPTSPVDDASSAELMTPLVSSAPINSATPAAQTTGMNAVAAAIGDKKSEKASAESAPMAAKTPNESAFAPLPAAPAAPTTVTRPMSETVMAQNTLAANGNAMEKVLSHQVSKALVQHLPNGDRVLVMRLTPPELGTVKIEVIERMGVLTAKLHAEDDGVRLALERFLPSMRQDLRASDAPIRELSMSDQTQFQRSFADGQNQQQQQQNAESSNRRARADEPRFNTDAARSDAVVAPRSAPLGGRVSMSEVNALA